MGAIPADALRERSCVSDPKPSPLRCGREQPNWGTLIECRHRRFDTRGFVAGAKRLKNCAGLIQQSTSGLDIPRPLAQGGACQHRLAQIVSRAYALEYPYGRVCVILGGGRRFSRQTFARQPTRAAFIMEIACNSTGFENDID